MPGPRKKPVKLKAIDGNRGKEILPESDTIIAPGVPLMPDFMKQNTPFYAAARDIWDEYLPRVLEFEVLTDHDAPVFSAWCCLYAEMQEDPKAFPAARMKELRTMSAELYLMPSARMKAAYDMAKKKKQETDKTKGWGKLA